MKSKLKKVALLVLFFIRGGIHFFSSDVSNKAGAQTKKTKICSIWTVNGSSYKKCDGTGTKCNTKDDC
ncbi:hypothetical protein [Thermoflexibacter ruber]|uniref:NVEALA protein n=1 Tax=Thermoflexibacter ruber TaxID=1003 RepID=A0A1I2FUW4_9BACT|nr:hypothetical protein [Thermoflexibacter ruber]SFF09224.1 hypothetical protein SAMN04488541_101588 [Thermoflexibacter ruber]